LLSLFLFGIFLDKAGAAFAEGSAFGVMRLTIVGRNPRSDGSECVIFGHVGRSDGVFVPVAPDVRRRELAVRGGWELREMRTGAGLTVAPALVGWTEGVDDCRTAGRLILISHRWSGRLQINNIGRKYVVDLYSPETRLTLLDAIDEVLIDVTDLATPEPGVATPEPGGFRLPRLTHAALAAHVAETGAAFRFLDRDADFRPGRLRRMLEAWRRPPDDRLKLRLVAALLPRVAARPPEPLPPPSPDPGLRDELRYLAAAVEGLALRARA
jgi:hypothetical protein